MTFIRKLPLAMACALGLAAAPVCAETTLYGTLDGSENLERLNQAEQQKWLMDHLPDSTDAYVRIPALPSLLLTDPKDQPEALDKAWAQVYPALIDWWLQGMPEEARPLLRVMAEQAASPLEVALIDVMSGQPQIRASVLLNGQNAADVDAMLAAVFKGSPFEVRSDQAGTGTLFERGKQVAAYRFDAESGRLLFMLDKKNAPDWQWTQQTTNAQLQAQLYALQGDTGNLFVWVKNQPQAAMIAAVEQPMLAALLLKDLQSLSLASSSDSDGYAAWLALDMPQRTGLRLLLPSHDGSDLSLMTHGQPQWAMLWSPPPAEDMTQFMQTIGKGNDYQSFKQVLADKHNIDVDVLLNAAATQWLMFADDNGQVTAIDAATEPMLNDAIEMLKKAGWITADEDVGHGIRHLTVSNKLFADMEEESKPVPRLLQALLSAPNDFYLKNEGDYLLVSSLPQPLMAREQSTADTSMQDWLSEAGVDVQKSSFAYVMPVQDLSQQHYYGTLHYLQQMGHVAGKPVNLTEMPTAQELALPSSGLLTFDVVNEDNALAFTLHSPHDLTDWLYTGSGNMTTVATAGILAAIAIPAYQDYVMRSEAMSAYVAAYNALQTAGTDKPVSQLSAAEKQQIVQVIQHVRIVKDVVFEDDDIALLLGGSFNDTWMTVTRRKQGGDKQYRCSFDTVQYERFLPSACD
ncbi:hypothetical protein KRX19_02520 [Cardiobacteriaceae bacterium TAE3-ERU3]|nr:hypothetical protein [Cardiobacteriaceae bacterium TAE3-ERU3]